MVTEVDSVETDDYSISFERKTSEYSSIIIQRYWLVVLVVNDHGCPSGERAHLLLPPDYLCSVLDF